MAPLVWLITGTSSGIGKSLVHAVLKRGDRVVATGRNAAERLAHYKEVEGVSVVDLDLCASEDDIQKAVDEAAAVHGRIDVLVNNAGQLSFGTVEEMRDDKVRTVFDVNVFGTMKVTRAVLPHMRKQRDGTIVMIGSMYGIWSGPGVSAYAASKHAVEAYADALQTELAPFNIRTTVFEPGYFRTGGLIPGKIVTPDLTSLIPDDYAPIHAAMKAGSAALVGKERGDEGKLVELMLDIIKGEGVAEGKKLPPRMPFGEDGVNVMEAHCRRTLTLVEKWKDVVTKTDRDDWVPDPASAALATPPAE